MKRKIEKAEGKLGILLPGMGAVATTLISGVLAIQKGIGQPIGSLTQMGTIRLGKRTENRNPLIKDFVPLADLNDIVFGGWDLFKDNAYETALKAGVLDKHLVEELKDELIKIKPMKAVFDKKYIVNLEPNNIKSTAPNLIMHKN